jgi:hypothetical protein
MRWSEARRAPRAPARRGPSMNKTSQCACTVCYWGYCSRHHRVSPDYAASQRGNARLAEQHRYVCTSAQRTVVASGSPPSADSSSGSTACEHTFDCPSQPTAATMSTAEALPTALTHAAPLPVEHAFGCPISQTHNHNRAQGRTGTSRGGCARPAAGSATIGSCVAIPRFACGEFLAGRCRGVRQWCLGRSNPDPAAGPACGISRGARRAGGARALVFRRACGRERTNRGHGGVAAVTSSVIDVVYTMPFWPHRSWRISGCANSRRSSASTASHRLPSGTHNGGDF